MRTVDDVVGTDDGQSLADRSGTLNRICNTEHSNIDANAHAYV